MPVVVQDVRNNLAGMSSQRLTDAEIQQQIDIAQRYIDYWKGKSADPDIVNDGVLWYATWQCYVVYIAEFERSTGRIPNPVVVELRRYETKAIEYLGMIRRAASTPTALISAVQMRTNRIQDNR